MAVRCCIIGTAEKKRISASSWPEPQRESRSDRGGVLNILREEGGMIGFLSGGEQGPFRNQSGCRGAKRKLKISARLLALAKTVIGSPKGN